MASVEKRRHLDRRSRRPAGPPPHLVTLVASSADLDGFLEHGLDNVAYLDQLLRRHGLSFDQGAVTLDFGCGCGRLARYIAPRVIAGEDYARMLKPGGVALVSFADEDRIDIAHPARRSELDRDGFLTSTTVLERSNYMSSYATVAAFTELASRVLDVIEVTPSGASGQTLAWAVLRRPG
jgi:hypothetical protein